MTTPPPSTSSSTSSSTTTTFVELPALAVTSATGVVVAVRVKTTAGYVVTTPCGGMGYVAGGTPVTDVSVVLDPGHGGPIDTGAVGRNGLVEKDVNLRLAEASKLILEKRGIATLLTRTADYAVPLRVRVDLADTVDTDILVSIHHNAPTPQASDEPGTEVFVQSDRPDSRRLGSLIYESTVAALSRVPGVQWHAAPDAGVLMVHSTRGGDGYGMISLPETVSVLAEFAYISSPPEAELLATDLYLEIASEALADAIEDYLTTDQTGSGFIEEPRIFNPQPSVGAALCEEVDLD
jgi:N-acetylmuramoyl-L-alanine amidase